MTKVSVEPFLRWVAEDAEERDFDEGFRLTDAPPNLLGFTSVATPKIEERCTTEGPSMNLPDVVQTAVRTKLQTELKPISEKLGRLKALLEAYEIRAKADAERRLTNAMLVALGEPQVASDPAFETVKKELNDALNHVMDLVGLGQPAPPPQKERIEPEPDKAPAQSPPAPPPSSQNPVVAKPEVTPPPSGDPIGTFTRLLRESDTTPPRPLKQEDVAWAKRLIVEVETLKGEIKDQHKTRLFPLLQALIAEIRLLLDRLPQDNYLHERLSTLVPLIGALKIEGRVDEFVRGLAFGSSGDWERLSFNNRRKVEAYDRDVAASERHPEVRGGKTAKKATPEDPVVESGHQWPSLPYLNKLTKPILLAGGILIPEKLKSVRERFGLVVEWHEIDHDNPRASGTLLTRVRAGKVGALVFLEGVMRHSTYKSTVEACNNMHVPYAMGDKAGVASLQAAFNDLERKLSSS